MTEKERNSLALQLRYAYAVNCRSTHPVHVDVCGLTRGGRLVDIWRMWRDYRAETIHARMPQLNFTTARLPLDEYLDFNNSTKVLTCNNVFEILQRYRECGYTDWRTSIMTVFPC